MKEPAAALAAILWFALAIPATAQIAAPVAAPDQVLKARALRLGYTLNAESMVREPHLGSIDVSGLLFVPDVTLIERPGTTTGKAPK